MKDPDERELWIKSTKWLVGTLVGSLILVNGLLGVGQHSHPLNHLSVAFRASIAVFLTMTALAVATSSRNSLWPSAGLLRSMSFAQVGRLGRRHLY